MTHNKEKNQLTVTDLEIEKMRKTSGSSRQNIKIVITTIFHMLEC